MKIFMIALGTRGDIQPYVGLALGLKNAGHDVTICSTANFESFVADYGLRFEATRDEIVELMATDEGKAVFDGDRSTWQTVKLYSKLAKRAGAIQMDMLEQSWQAAERTNPDVILYHPKGYGGPHFAEKLGIPVILTLVVPGVVPTSAFPAFGFPTWNLGGGYNRLTSKLLMKSAALSLGKYVQTWRKNHGLPEVRGGVSLVNKPNGKPIPAMHGFSQHVLPFPADWPDYAAITGYWFLNQPEQWQPPQNLVDFLNAGAPPVYVGFGSMSNTKTAKVSRIVVDALKKAGVRGIIAKGWGGIEAKDLPDSILAIDGAPHDWLFPRMSAVVHHGGAGTTSAGLRAGKPSVVCPFFGDQPFWGRRVEALGAGPKPIAQKDLETESLATAIRAAVETASYRENAESIGEKLRQEDSIGPALAFIERQMAEQA